MKIRLIKDSWMKMTVQIYLRGQHRVWLVAWLQGMVLLGAGLSASLTRAVEISNVPMVLPQPAKPNVVLHLRKHFDYTGPLDLGETTDMSLQSHVLNPLAYNPEVNY
ncbi:MAG: hypothetical protein RMK60_12165, partial [Burkholderiales bacterium]|nr:hypothetical protein [Burkholderiales bacterium]